MDLLRDGFSHLFLSHFLEGIHLLRQSLETVSDFGALESKLAFNFSPDLRFSLSHVDEGFVSHDLFALVQLTFELRGHLLFFSSLEGLKALLHFNLKFKRSFFLE